MRYLLFALFLSVGCGSKAHAQQQRPISVKINLPGMQCDACKKQVEDVLRFEDGVSKYVAYPKSRYVLVSFVQDRTNIEILKTAIANVGFDADDVPANEEAYRRLPTPCKKPEDGGTHKRN